MSQSSCITNKICVFGIDEKIAKENAGFAKTFSKPARFCRHTHCAVFQAFVYCDRATTELCNIRRIFLINSGIYSPRMA